MNKTKLGILEDMLIKKEKIKSEDSSLRVENTAEGLQASITCIESNKIEQETREGYNLVDERSLAIKSINDYMEKIEDGIYTTQVLSGYGNSRVRFDDITLFSGEIYYLSMDIKLLSGNPVGVMNAINIIGAKIKTNNKLVNIIPNTLEYQRLIIGVEIEEDETVTSGLIVQSNREAVDVQLSIKNIQISKINAPYEKYGAMPSKDFQSPVEGVTGNVNLKVQNKNLVDYSKFSSQTVSGLSITNNNDGTLTLNGTPTANVLRGIQIISPHLKKGTKIFFSGCPSGGNPNTYRCDIRRMNGNVYSGNYDIGNGAEVTLEEDGGCLFYIRIEAETIINNLVFKPFICLVDEKNKDFSKHKEQDAMISLGDKTLFKNDKLVYLNKNNPNATEGAGWYFVSKMFKYIFDGTETWRLTNTQPNNKDWHAFYPSKISNKYSDGVRSKDICFSNYYQNTNNGVMASVTIINYAISNIVLTNPATSGQIMFVSQNFTVEEMKAECKKLYDEGNPLYVVYTLQEPTYKPVTNKDLIKQLDSILLYMTEYEELTNFDFDQDVTFEIIVEKDRLSILENKLDNIEQNTTSATMLALESEV